MNNAVHWIFVNLFALVMVSACHEKPQSTEQKAQQKQVERVFFRSPAEVVTNRCTPSPDGALLKMNCAEGSICVAPPGGRQGHCLQKCETVIEGVLSKDQTKCGKSLVCMPYKPVGTFTMGMFCMQKQNFENLDCGSHLSPDACGAGLTCLATEKGTLEDGSQALLTPKCKRECLEDKECGLGKACLFPSYARIDRLLGVCGSPVPLATAKDFRGSTFVGETCNEHNGNRFCAAIPGTTLKPNCQRLGTSSGEGVCVVPCSIPALDSDGDGKIGEGEGGGRRDCPTELSCSLDMARKLSLYRYISVDDEHKKCSLKRCGLHKPCPDCGLGDAECIRLPGNWVYGSCGAPFGLCEANNV